MSFLGCFLDKFQIICHFFEFLYSLQANTCSFVNHDQKQTKSRAKLPGLENYFLRHASFILTLPNSLVVMPAPVFQATAYQINIILSDG